MFARFESRAATRMHGGAARTAGDATASRRAAALAAAPAAAHAASAPSLQAPAAAETPGVHEFEHAPYGASSEYFATASPKSARASSGGLSPSMQKAVFLALLIFCFAVAGANEAAAWLEREENFGAVLLYFTSAMTAAGCGIALAFFAAKAFTA